MTGPVPVARLAKGNVSISIILTQRMFLASGNVLRPITGMCLLVVEEAADTELLGSGTVPARPVPGARRLVTEDAVQPVTVLSALRRISFRSSVAVHVVRIVAFADQTKSSIVVENQTIGTGL